MQQEDTIRRKISTEKMELNIYYRKEETKVNDCISI
jgi:hypothetical protein